MNKGSEGIEMNYRYILLLFSLFFLCISLIASPLALSQNTGDREENRQEMEMLQEITRIVTGLRFMEENRDHALQPIQAEEILSLLASLVHEGLIYRARSLRLEILEILRHFLNEEEEGLITQELERRQMEDHEERALRGEGGEEQGSGRLENRDEILSQGSLKREEQALLGEAVVEELKQILSSAQLRWIEALPLTSLIGAQVSRGRGQGAETQESGEILILFEELVEWFLWEKVGSFIQ